MFIPSAVSKQQEIDAVVAEIAHELAGDIVRIRYNIDTDWSGDWGIFFRVVLKDAATRGKRFPITTSKIRGALAERLAPLDLGLIIYANFRSQSEQAELRDKAWD